MIGERFGKLTVVAYAEPKFDKQGYKRKQYLCRCDCGNEKVALEKELKNGHVKSCGCMQGNRGDMTGQVFGRLTVLGFHGMFRSEITNHTYRMWDCKCSCGNKVVKSTSELRSGHINSCGCFRSENTREFAQTHGMSHTRIYEIWVKMIARCYNPNTTYYCNYGGRGIKVCDEWLSGFEPFWEWAKNSGYKDNLTIERVDNDGNYCPENCTWITRAKQNRNRRTNHPVTYRGEKMLLTDLSKLTRIAPQTIRKYEEDYNYDYDAIINMVLSKPEHQYGRRSRLCQTH